MPTRILLADDNEIIRDRLSELLTRHGGWEVCAAVGNGRDAVKKALELTPSLIILDLVMPQMDGLSAAQEIGKALPSVPIVLFTLHSFRGIELEAKKAGVRQVVSKNDVGALLHVAEELVKSGPPESAQVKTELLASVSGPPDAPITALTTQPAPSELQASANSDPETSPKSN
jgi:two-component system response regulator DesR